MDAPLMLILDWPPSVNHYWRNLQGRTLLSAKGRDYRAVTAWQCRQQLSGLARLRGRLAVAITAHAPTRRAWDLDNRLKAILDALAHGGAYLDDGQIDRLEIIRGDVCRPNGRVVVRIEELDDFNAGIYARP